MAIGFGLAMLVSAIIAAAASSTAAGLNYNAQQNTNAANAKAVQATNAQNQYNLEHAHQIEMADLKAAGLNPVLTATGGQGAPMTAMQAPHAQAPNLDLSGISTAINSMTHMMMMKELIDSKVEAAEVGAKARNDVADKYISSRRQMMASLGDNEGQRLISSAKQVGHVSPEKYMADLAKKMGMSVKDLKRIAGYRWIKRSAGLM